MVAVRHGARQKVRRIRASLRFGQGEGSDRVSRRHVGKKSPFLLFRPELEDWEATNGAVNAHDRRAGAIARRYFLERHRVRELADICPAVLLREKQTEKAEFAHFPNGIVRISAVGVPPRCERRQPFLREPTRHVLYRERLVRNAAARSGCIAPGVALQNCHIRLVVNA
jgi:hypothetical protein